jgi:hypothetical protein
MARLQKGDAMMVLSIRVPAKMVEALDRYTEHLKAEMPLLTVDRAFALRELLAKSLAEFVKPSRQPKRG